MTPQPDDDLCLPDGPPPDREQLPLPRRQRQAHLEPHLRTPGSPGAGTPFAAFTAEDAPDPARTPPPDRAAAFHAGTRRGRGTTGPYGRSTGGHRTDR